MLQDIMTLTEQIRRARSAHGAETASIDRVIHALRCARETGMPLTATNFSFHCVWPHREIGERVATPVACIATKPVPGTAAFSAVALFYYYHYYLTSGIEDFRCVQTWCFGPKMMREAWDRNSYFLRHRDFITFHTAVRRMMLEGSEVSINAAILADGQLPSSFTYRDTPASTRYEGWNEAARRLLNGRDLERGYRRPLFHDDVPIVCDLCGREFSSQLYLVHGRLIDGRILADMCVPCAARLGRGVGRDRGRLYARHENGGWFCVAGFSFRPTTAD